MKWVILFIDDKVFVLAVAKWGFEICSFFAVIYMFFGSYVISAVNACNMTRMSFLGSY